ncbi:muramidase [Legionella sp.]|uniref:muramidase n=1 Tax=Legionella sp. TaxID=459 RepID=UPI000CCB0CD3|nr:muramidase [Legionella sp.]PJE09587.1 MAG: conjugal transfer protein TrbN [Legionella sp.]
MIPIIDLAPFEKERVVCAILAAIKYEIPTNIVLAIAEKEAGTPGLWVKNKNGSYDVGAMQLNTTYLQDLAKFGISPDDVAQAGCYAYDLAAWRIRGHLQHDKQDLWTRAANYHSKTPKYNRIYREDLIKKATKWKNWLNHYVLTYSVTTPQLSKVFLKSVVRADSIDVIKIESSQYQPKPKPNVANSSSNKSAAYALASVFRPEQVSEYQ